MTSENLGQLRERLLREESVQRMIRARAYEIYQMRGGQPGGDAHDWFQAESEVLAFLIADESPRTDENEAERSRGVVANTKAHREPRAPKKSKPRAESKPGTAKQAPPKRTATKRAASKKTSETRPKRTRRETKTEENRQ